MMSIITKNKEKRLRKAYEEVLSFLGIIEKEYYEKIPKDFIKFLEENKDNNYSKVIYQNIPIKQQKLMKETLEIIAFLKIKYFSESDEEKDDVIRNYKTA